MSTFCQPSYHRKCQRWGVGGQKKPKSCQHSVWTTAKTKIYQQIINVLFQGLHELWTKILSTFWFASDSWHWSKVAKTFYCKLKRKGDVLASKLFFKTILQIFLWSNGSHKILVQFRKCKTVHNPQTPMCYLYVLWWDPDRWFNYPHFLKSSKKNRVKRH